MPEMKFRSSFSVRTRLGSRRKYISKRTASKIDSKLPPLLIVDLDYIEALCAKRKSSAASNYYNVTNLSPLYNVWLTRMLNLVTPSGILFIAERETEFTQSLGYPIIYNSIKNYIYTLKANNTLSNPFVVASNNLELWALSSNSANLSFLAVDSNNRILHYNNNTGLEIVSKFIGTYKIINKLGLANLKHLNLQYLFILLHYLRITNRSEQEFYFDGTYFRDLDKYDKPFLRSNGLGLSLISDAHKFLSYAFLTKPEFLDFFLLSDGDHYELQLSRLAKLLPIDIQVLNKLKQQYDFHSKPAVLASLILPNLTPKLPGEMTAYSNIWLKRNPSTTYAEHKALAKSIHKYSCFPNYDLSVIIATLPMTLQRDFGKIERSPNKKTVDTSDVEDYVSNLISGVF